MIYRNKTAHRNYEILDKIEAGISLLGSEVKSIRLRGIKLEDAFVKIVDGAPRLVNALIQPYSFAPDDTYDSKRTRKLLLNKKEIIKLQTKLLQSPQLTIIPLSCYTKRGMFKLEIALAKGRKSWQVKRVEQARAEKKREQKEIKEFVNLRS